MAATCETRPSGWFLTASRRVPVGYRGSRLSRAAPGQRVPRIASRGQGWGGKLILTVLVLTIVEGALRKWAFPNSTRLGYGIYFSKDVVFFLAGLLGAYAVTRQLRQAVSFLLPISCLLILPSCLYNFSSISPFGAAISVRAYLLLPLAAFLATGTIRSLRDVDRIVYVVGTLAILAAILGFVQFNLPAGHVLNRYVGEQQLVATAFGHVRACGPFSYISGMSLMAPVAAWAGSYLVLSAKQGFRGIYGLAVMAAGGCCSLVTVSRSSALFFLVTAAMAVLLFRRMKQSVYIGVLGFAAVAFLVLTEPGNGEDPGLFGSLVRRSVESHAREQVNYGYLGRLSYELSNIRNGLSYPLGVGLGSAQRGSAYLAKEAWGFPVSEGEIGRILLEIGWPGLLGVFLWRITVIVLLWRALRSAHDPRIRALLAASLPLILVLSEGSMAFNHIGNSFAWAIATLALASTTWTPRRFVLAGQQHGR